MTLPAFISNSVPYRVSIHFLKKVHFTRKRINLYVFLLILIKEISKDNLIERSRGMAYSFLLSIFPAVIFVFTLIPYFPIPELPSRVMESLGNVLPQSVYETVSSTIMEIISIPKGGLMSFGFLFAMYSATNGIMAMMHAFNQCYSSADKRSFIKRLMISLSVILLLTIIIVLAIGVSLLLKYILYTLPLISALQSLGLSVAQYAIIFMIFYVAISSIYYLVPAVQKRWSFFTHGSFIATVMLMIFTVLFSFYIDNFNSYNKIYGSIGALIGLMIWFQMVSLTLLVGFEINACIEMAGKEYYKKKFL
jgi:membrane protein